MRQWNPRVQMLNRLDEAAPTASANLVLFARYGCHCYFALRTFVVEMNGTAFNISRYTVEVGTLSPVNTKRIVWRRSSELYHHQSVRRSAVAYWIELLCSQCMQCSVIYHKLLYYTFFQLYFIWDVKFVIQMVCTLFITFYTILKLINILITHQLQKCLETYINVKLVS